MGDTTLTVDLLGLLFASLTVLIPNPITANSELAS